MAQAREGRLRHDDRTDSFIYETRCNGGSWGLVIASKCVRREGAEEGEDTNYVHFELLKRLVFDADVYGVKLHIM